MTVPGVISPGMAARRGWPLVDILLATDDGVSSVTAEGVITEHFVGGDLLAAVDDTMGGIVFQIGQQYVDNGRYDQIIYWLPAGGDAVVELISVAEGSLVLHDVVLVDSGPTVVYVYDDEVDGFENEQSLNLFEIESQVLTDLGFVAGWESGTGPISAAPSLLAYEWFAVIHSGFAFVTLAGESTDVAGDPYGITEDCIEGVVFDYETEQERPGCPSDLTISSDGSRLAYLLPFEGPEGFLTDFMLVLATPGGTIIGTAELSRQGFLYGVNGLEVSGDRVIVNRTESGAWDAPQSYPLMVDVATGEQRVLNYLGYARFVEQLPAVTSALAP